METPFFSFFEITEDDDNYVDYLHFRYLIFVKELKSLTQEKHRDQKERDQFDCYSRHIIAWHNESQTIAACARLILPNPIGLNTESRYQIEQHPYPDQFKDNTGEISRMAISPMFRRRKEDIRDLIEGDPNREFFQKNQSGTDKSPDKRNYQPGLIMGMYREIYYIAQQEAIKFCLAAMERRFSRLLIKSGYPFHPVGPENPVLKPLRRPFIISQEEMKIKLAQSNPELMDFMQQKSI